ncbi:MAG TPA: polyprenyl synthetase family protein [Candidatus Saccharimonadales bacterium]|nr:polyprenyl synthetase family protein [Candidatus Saccharimonadales bacterium]
MQSQLESYRQRIDNALADFFESDLSAGGLELNDYELKLLGYLKEFTLRPGKRLRGALTLFAYESLAGESSDSIINAAIAQELVQSYLCIIDDVMDRSPERRGKPTVHRLLAAELGKSSEYLASMMAINVGLLGEHLASYILSLIEAEPARLSQASQVLHRNILATVYGQMDDLNNDLKVQATEAQIIHLLEMKVSYYSFISPLQLGAILAGKAEPDFMKEIESIGRPAGVAFQLQDDLLGLFGNPTETGKSAQDDLKEGKFTLLMLYTLERAGHQNAGLVRKALGNQHLSQSEFEEVQAIVENCGARSAVEAKAQEFSTKTKKAITSSSFDQAAKDFLSDLIDYVTSRNK